MTDAEALAALIAHVNASDKPVLVGWDEVAQWREGLLVRLVKLGLVKKDVNSKSLTCLGCEHHCTMDILLTDDAKRAFIVCDHPEMQNQMGRVKVPMERLQQWQTGAKQFSSLIASLLKIETKPEYSKETATYKLGMLNAVDGRRWVTLQSQPLRLEIAGHSVLMEDLLFFNGDDLVVDVARVESLLASSPVNIGKAYTPNTNKQDARKLATQAMYQNWCDEYQALRRKHPDKTDVWYSIQIAKLPMAQGKSAETIRKHMKK